MIKSCSTTKAVFLAWRMKLQQKSKKVMRELNATHCKLHLFSLSVYFTAWWLEQPSDAAQSPGRLRVRRSSRRLQACRDKELMQRAATRHQTVSGPIGVGGIRPRLVRAQVENSRRQLGCCISGKAVSTSWSMMFSIWRGFITSVTNWGCV